jgi:hypothetical protein
MRTYALLCCSESSKFGVETASLLLLPIESSDGALRGMNADLPNLLSSSSSSACYNYSKLISKWVVKKNHVCALQNQSEQVRMFREKYSCVYFSRCFHKVRDFTHDPAQL